MPRRLDAVRARELVNLVQSLGDATSFRNILREVARAGVLRRHETLRLYLDLLAAGRVLEVRTRDVGSVNLQQLYHLKSKNPIVSVGPAILRRYGLNWDVRESERRNVSTDFEGLVRSTNSEAGLMASLEDCLVREVYADGRENTGTTSLVVAILSTRNLDLPYLLGRADGMHVGMTMRFLYRRILEIASSTGAGVSASVFLPVRNQFLGIVRRHSQTGFWKLVEEKGRGNVGLRVARGLTESDVIMTAGKQLAVTG